MTPFRPSLHQGTPTTARPFAGVTATARPTRVLKPADDHLPPALIVLVLGAPSGHLQRQLDELCGLLDGLQIGWMALEIGDAPDRLNQLALLVEDAHHNHPAVLLIETAPVPGAPGPGERFLDGLMGSSRRWRSCPMLRMQGDDPWLLSHALDLTQAWRQTVRATRARDEGRPRAGDGPPAGPPRAQRRLGKALGAWLDLRLEDLDSAGWRALEQARGAAAFARFLNRLHGLGTRVRRWARAPLVQLVQAMQDDAGLRQRVLETVRDATQSCDDRVSLVWTQLQTLLRVDRINLGGLDHDLPALVRTAREVFRHDALQQVASAHVRHLRAAHAPHGPGARDVEDVEVYLAHAVQLHSALALSGPAPPAWFVRERISGVDLRQVSRALRTIRRRENETFVRFLADWEPWRNVLRRLAPAEAQRIEADITDPGFVEAITTEVNNAAQLAQIGSVWLHERDRVSAENQAIASACNDRIAARWLELGAQVLGDRQLDGLLLPAWQEPR